MNALIIEALERLLETGEAELLGWTLNQLGEEGYAASKGLFGITSDDPQQLVTAVVALDQTGVVK